MGICGGSSTPGIEIVLPNKYTINVENDNKKVENPITLKQNNNTIQANTNSTNNINIKLNKTEEITKKENLQIHEKKNNNNKVMFNIQSSQNLMNAKSRSNRQIVDFSDVEERKKRKIKNK